MYIAVRAKKMSLYRFSEEEVAELRLALVRYKGETAG